MKTISRFILYKIFKWKTVGKFPSDLKKYIIIAAPHTHWQDFFVGMCIKYAERLPVKFIGKKSLFNPPFGFIFRALGGYPVDRSKNTKLVEEIVNIFNNNDEFVFALSPEGTRKKVEKWKTGFYYIAKGAKVPIVMATLNFKDKEVKVSKPYYTTDDIDKDFDNFHSFFKGVKGKIPENF